MEPNHNTIKIIIDKFQGEANGIFAISALVIIILALCWTHAKSNTKT